MQPEIVWEIDGQRQVRSLDRDEIIVGRDEANDVVVRKPSISRRHARIWLSPEGWRVADLGSLNGTRVNDGAVSDKVLSHGDTIWLHDLGFLFSEKPTDGTAAVRLRMTADRPGSAPMSTMVRSAVDFSALAAAVPDAARFPKLLSIATRASEALLACASAETMFGRVLELIFEHLPVQRGCILLQDASSELTVRCVRDRDGSGDAAGEIRFSRTIAEQVLREKVAVLTSDAQADKRFAAGASIFALDIHSAIAAPIWSGDRVEGLIYVDTLVSGAFDRFDLDLLSALGNLVAAALEQARLQNTVLEQKLVRERLERYHSPAVAARIAASERHGGPIADEREVTVLFADIVGFSGRCELMEPLEVADLLNRYFSEMVDEIFARQGTLDKFIGDCLMAVFGAPLVMADHAQRAVEAALGMREALERLNAPVAPESRVQFRVGLNSGRVVSGDMGSTRRREYTVLGATVNIAARIEAVVAEPGQIVITDATLERLDGRFQVRALGERVLRGIQRPIGCHALIGWARQD